MPTIEEILRAAKEAGASDVHLTVGIPPKMRVNGNLITMDYPRMLPADTLEVLVNIMTEVQRERFEERGEYDMSFSIPNCAPDVYGSFTPVTGTSFATPIVSGAAALLMEWGIVRGNDPFLYGEKVKAYFRKGARPLRGETEYPNDRVGYGKLCVAESLLEN